MKKILLIEDDELMGKLYYDLLSQEKDFQVSLITDGKIAYNKIIENNWDLILLDTLLPKMNALDILNNLKKTNPEKLKQKIVIITNLDDGQEIESIKSYNFEVINKSQLNPDQFLVKIKSYLI